MNEQELNNFVTRLKELQNSGDPECAHSAADGILCEILEALGYDEVINEYDKIDKWYA